MKIKDVVQVLLKLVAAGAPVLLTGAPGVGKTDIVGQVQTTLGYDLIVSHPVVSDPTDAKGLPFPDAEAGVARFLPFGEMARALNATRPTIWFLDDLGQASPAVQAAFMQLILARRIDGHRLPDCVRFVAATNRRQDRAGVAGILEPVKSRFVTIINVEPDIDSWCQWAYGAGMPQVLIAFLRMRELKREPLLHSFEPTPDLTNSPSPRTWANLGLAYNLGISAFGRSVALETYAGAVGLAAATEFVAFDEVAHEMPNPDAVLLAPRNAVIPEKLSVLSMLLQALANRVNESNFGRYCEYAQRLYANGQGEFSALMVRDALVVCPEVQSTAAYTKLLLTDLGELVK